MSFHSDVTFVFSCLFDFLASCFQSALTWACFGRVEKMLNILIQFFEALLNDPLPVIEQLQNFFRGAGNWEQLSQLVRNNPSPRRDPPSSDPTASLNDRLLNAPAQRAEPTDFTAVHRPNRLERTLTRLLEVVIDAILHLYRVFQNTIQSLRDTIQNLQTQLAQAKQECEEKQRTIDLLTQQLAAERQRLATRQRMFGLADTEMLFFERLFATMQWRPTPPVHVLFDSTRDEATAQTFFRTVRGRPNVMVMATTNDGNVFGGFYALPVHRPDRESRDPNIFLFSFASNGRCDTPAIFPVRADSRGDVFVRVFSDDRLFVWFGTRNGSLGFGFNGGSHGERQAQAVVQMAPEADRSHSFCCNVVSAFQNLDNATLTGGLSSYMNGPYLKVSRIVAFQLSLTL